MSDTESPGGRDRALIDVALRALSALSEELRQAVRLQEDMTADLSRELMSLSTAAPHDFAPRIASMISALQLEDLIHQRLDGVTTALGEVCGALQAATRGTEGEAPHPEPDTSLLWANRIVESQRIQHMRTRMRESLMPQTDESRGASLKA